MMFDLPIPKNSLLNVVTPVVASTESVNDPLSTCDEPDIFKTSPYISKTQLVEMLKSKINSFSIISLNCQSLRAKFEDIVLLIDELNDKGCRPSTICLQETWLNNEVDISAFNIDGYNIINQPSAISSHGGLLIYLRDDFEFCKLPNIESQVFESQFISVKYGSSSKDLYLGNFYRPPKVRDMTVNNCIDTFSSEFASILQQFSKKTGFVVLAGDFNLDLLKINEESWASYHLDNVISNGYIPTITLPSRFDIAHGTSSLIDNIFVRCSLKLPDYSAGILCTKISDHFLCFVSIELPFLKNLKKRPPKYITIKDSSPENIKKFQQALSDIKFQDHFNLEEHANPNFNYNALENIIAKIMSDCFPVRTVKFNRYKHKHQEWMTSALLKSIEFRDNLYIELHNTNFNSDSDLYNTRKTNLHTYNMILKDSIRKAKLSYISNMFDSCKGNLKKTWKSINRVLNRGKCQQPLPDIFRVGDSEISDKQAISDVFNTFFSEIGANLASKIPSPEAEIDFMDFLIDKSDTTFTFNPVDRDSILKAIDSIPSKFSCGYDQISSDFLKQIKFEIVDIVTLIVNQSLRSGIFPDKLKIAKVIPVYKKGDNHLIDNYRPISLLPAISKIFERIMHDQLFDYFTRNNLFFPSQYGFRKSHSTELASVELIDRVLEVMNQNGIPICIFMDLSKAFDTLNHCILLEKLKFYGLDETSRKLFSSYLSGRLQFVSIDGALSSFKPLSTGVPQGSILGPLLFLVYINDIFRATTKFKVTCYADDTTLSANVEDFISANGDVSAKLNQELSKISDWLLVNKLSLNVSKTNYMLFYKPGKLLPDISVNIRGEVLTCVDSFTFLGLTLDSCLSWKPHFGKICNKISKIIGVLSRLKNFLSSEILLTLYNALILPHINYSILVWGFSNTTRILKLQKKAIRLIMKRRGNAHTDALFKSLKILKVDDIFLRFLLKFYYNYYHGYLPSYFRTFSFTSGNTVHYHNTRHKNMIRPGSTSKVYTSLCVRFGLTKILNFISSKSNFSHKYNDTNFLSFDFKSDKLLSKPKELLSSFFEKVNSYTSQGFSNYIKVKFIEIYDTVPCTRLNCVSCRR